MKVLGWHFSSSPNATAYIEVLKRRFRERYCVLRHLKRNLFSTEDLIKVYTSIVRPVADYMMIVYHSMITDSQDEALERFQTHALKCIFGPRLSGWRMRQMIDLPTLRERQIEAVDKFAHKCADSWRRGPGLPGGPRKTLRSLPDVKDYLIPPSII